MKSTVTLQFLGACGTVTGSKYLVTINDRSLMVDCGLFQGLKQLRERNWDTLPIDVPAIDTLLLTHGHLDHTGYLPKLIQQGFKGTIMANAPTLAIAEVILRDSARIQEDDARDAHKKGYSRHPSPQPLYRIQDVERTLQHFKAVPNDEWIHLWENVSCRFRYNGHILGASFIELKIDEQVLVFSGDIGRRNDPLLFDPQKPEKADILLIESTYGNRLHPTIDVLAELDQLLQTVAREKSTLIIPSFAVERTQLLMLLFWKLQLRNKLYGLPLYLDTPMGDKVLDAFLQFEDWHKIPRHEWQAICKDIRFISSQEENEHLLADNSGKIVIAGSGMASGGRVLSFLEKYVSRANAHILLVGFQAEGTRGRQLLDGIHEVKIKGRFYPVRARIHSLNGLSAHADQTELLEWLSALKQAPQKLFIVHGEPQAADTLRVKIHHELGWDAIIPQLGQSYDLSN